MSALTDVKIECAGRWDRVLMALGLPEWAFSGKHGDCLWCKDQRKNARWDRKKERFICSKCGSTGAMDAALLWTGKTFKETAEIIRGTHPKTMEYTRKQDDTEKNRQRIEQIRKGLKHINGECIASRYLAKRGLTVLPEKDCYFHPGVEYWDNGRKQVLPAMVSVFRDLQGRGATLHITYLDENGSKAPVESPKKILPVVLPLQGCAIQLFKPVNGWLAVAEGIETALAIHQDQGLSVWAAGNANNLANMSIPDEVTDLWIYADMDSTFTGQAASYTLAKRMAAKGKKVRVELLTHEMTGVREWTDSGDKIDFLDYVLIHKAEQLKAHPEIAELATAFNAKKVETDFCKDCTHWTADKQGDGTGVGDCAKGSTKLCWPEQTACKFFEKR